VEHVEMSEQFNPDLRLDQGFMERAHATLGREFAKHKYNTLPGDIMVDANGRYSFKVRTVYGDQCITISNPMPGRFLVTVPVQVPIDGQLTEKDGECFLDIGTEKFKVTKQTLVTGEQVVMKTFSRLPEKYTFAALVRWVCSLVGRLLQGYRMEELEKKYSKKVCDFVNKLTTAFLEASPETIAQAEEALRYRANGGREAGSLPGPARAPPAPVRPPIPAHPAAVGGGVQAQHVIAPPRGGVQHGQVLGLYALAKADAQAAASAQAAAGAQAVAVALAGPGRQHMHALVAPAAAGALAGPQPMPAAGAQAVPPASVGPVVGAGGGGDGGAAGGGGGAFRIIFRPILPRPVDPGSVVDLSKDDDDEVAIIKETQVAPADNFNREEWEKAKRPRGA